MYFKQIQEIIDGTKTQTRRVCKPNEIGEKGLVIPGSYVNVHTLYDGESRRHLKWAVGRDYAVSPGRGKRGLLWGPGTGIIWDDTGTLEYKNSIDHLTNLGFIPLRIRLLEIRREPLQAITESDAIAEGVQPELMTGSGANAQWSYVSAYRHLWESINGPGSWDANPDVWVLTFEVVK